MTAKPLPGAAGMSITIRDITEARRWEQSRELFVALTSHELRTPVTVIKGYADTLNDRWDLLDDRGRRYAASVLGQRAGDLARLLDRLLSAVSDLGVPTVRVEVQPRSRGQSRAGVAAGGRVGPAERGRSR